MNFITFKNAVAAQFAMMSQHELFTTTVDVHELCNLYITSFPEGTNPVYKTNTEHDCTCCKQFIRAVGSVVAIIDGKLVSIWDVELPAVRGYKEVAAALSARVKAHSIDNLFLHWERKAGADKTLQGLIDGGVKSWNHFFVNIPVGCFSAEPGPILSQHRATHDVLKRSLEEITDDALDTVLELISQGSLYRGEEHKFAVEEFKKLRKVWAIGEITDLDLFVWSKVKVLPQSVSRIRNTAIGTLMVDLSNGVDMDKAVASFEAKVAPQNYKRPTALVTKSMIESAKKKLEELGLVSALERRYATINDITINNILFANREARQTIEGSVFDTLIAKAEKPKNLDKVESVSIEDFLVNILPKADSIEVMMDNQHTGNLVSLIAPSDPTALPMFKWDNKFSWSYNGEMADSIKERVKQAGGNVTGELCCRLAWDYEDDLDFYMQEPQRSSVIYYGCRRQRSMNGGMLDVDANGMDGIKENPVENIFYEKLNTMQPGKYSLYVKNYTRRSNSVGFEAEIDISGTLHRFTYDKGVPTTGSVPVVAITVNPDRSIHVAPYLPSTQVAKQVWGIHTNTFQKVNVVMMSPNFWDGQTGIGNKHYFFMLDSCRNEGRARGFFNEFLRSDLDEHRKVIEMVGSKMKTEESSQQLSGLGFSSTKRNSLMCRVKGSFTRIINITF